MSTQRDQRLALEIVAAKQRRLEALEIQAANYGIDVPPHIATEIRTLQSEIALADIVNRPALDPTIAHALRQNGNQDLLGKFIGDHARRLSAIESWQVKRDERLDEDDKRRQARQRQFDLILGALIVASIVNSVFNIIVIIKLLRK